MILRWTSRETLAENKKENKDPAKKYETDTFLQDLFLQKQPFRGKVRGIWMATTGWMGRRKSGIREC